MDLYAWVLLGCSVFFALMVIVGLWLEIKRNNADFNVLIERNAEIEVQIQSLKTQNELLKLERDFCAVVMRKDELPIVRGEK